jgi:hypothetical protein
MNERTDREDRTPFSTHRGMSLGQRLREPDSYGLLLILIVVSMALLAVSDRHAILKALSALALGGSLGFALHTSRTRLSVRRPAMVGTILLTALTAGLALAGHSQGVRATFAALSAVLVLAALAAIFDRLSRHPAVTGATVLGALCAYLLIGVLFSSIYALVGVLGSQPFFAQLQSARTIDYVYFSFVTLTTVGYGDLTASHDLARMLAVTEALTGQLYLVTIVAVTVSHFGTVRHRPGANDRSPRS